MTSKGFKFNLLVRVLLLVAAIFLFVKAISVSEKYLNALLLSGLITFQVYNLYHYVVATNRKLTLFLESVKQSNFNVNFHDNDNNKDDFRELNEALNELLEVFRKTKIEKEENLQYLNTVVQHVQVGLLSYDSEGNIELINSVARRFLNVSQIKNIKQLQYANQDMYRLIKELPSGGKHLLRQSNEMQLSINATELILHNKKYKLLSIQNIKSELQEKEVEAWQNLTKVLRHEIMNSIAPITSLVATLSEILDEDVVAQNGHFELQQESIEDIKEGLRTIQNRSEGLRRFVDAYRSITTIPTPKMKRLRLKDLFNQVIKLMQADLKENGIQIQVHIQPQDLKVTADPQLFEMVLINIIKNAIEALEQKENKQIWLSAEFDENKKAIIKILDNGPGIDPDAINSIFIPFFTTKVKGSGIGLALSRQIVQMHAAELTVESEPEKGTSFFIHFS